MINSSNLIFGSTTNLALAATPSAGSYLVAYDSVTGHLSQKDDQGVISIIGVAATASGVLETFPSDISVSLSSGKSFGKYVNGDTIPANGKTAVEVIIGALSEPIVPTISLNSSTSINFNQTAISNLLTYGYVINSVGATAASVTLDWRRNNTGSWTTLSTDINLTSFTHSLTDTNFNSNPFNYRYTVTDSQGATTFVTKNITPVAYQAPSISLSVIAATKSGPETNSKREKGNIASNISGLITRNSSLVSLSYYQLQYQKNGSGSWLNIGATVSITGATAAIPTTLDNNTSSLPDATSILYRVVVTDTNTNTTSTTSTVSLYNVIFYGPTSLAPDSSGSVRALPNKIFTDGSNPFILNTGNVERIFTISLPTSLSVTQVLDLDSLSANITSSYISTIFSINDFYGTPVSYKVYTMTNAVAYSDLPSHRHQITRS